MHAHPLSSFFDPQQYIKAIKEAMQELDDWEVPRAEQFSEKEVRRPARASAVRFEFRPTESLEDLRSRLRLLREDLSKNSGMEPSEMLKKYTRLCLMFLSGVSWRSSTRPSCSSCPRSTRRH